MVGFSKHNGGKHNVDKWNNGSDKYYFSFYRVHGYFAGKIWTFWSPIQCWEDNFIIYMSALNKGKAYINSVKMAEWNIDSSIAYVLTVSNRAKMFTFSEVYLG